MRSKTNKWLCVITLNEQEVFNQRFICIEEISKELQLSKNIIFDIASKRRSAKKYENCRFFPNISITRLP
jgi:hypothetical protein